jgi:NADPH2:quinone reductase
MRTPVKAIVANSFGPVQNLRLEERPAPVPSAGEVLIDVSAAAVNYPDILVIGGKYQVKPPLPFIPGKELAGTVAKVGPNVTKFKPGDRVCALLEYGAFAQRVVAPSSLCLPVPDDISLYDAAGIGVAYQTAYFSIHHRGKVRPRENVIVTGPNGSVGLATMQLIRAAGAKVIAVVSHADKEAFVRRNGANDVVLFKDGDNHDAFREKIRALTDGKGADLFVDMVGGELFDACLRTLAWEGRAVIVGFMSGKLPSIRANYLLVKNIAAIGVQWSDYRDRAPDEMARVQETIFRLFKDGSLHFHRMGLYPFVNFLDAFEVLTQRRTTGKVILDFAGQPPDARAGALMHETQ